MANYYVNREKQSNGDHEVHKSDCKYFPSNNIYLGEYSACYQAVIKAKEHYQQVNGCVHCSKDCHTQ